MFRTVLPLMPYTWVASTEEWNETNKPSPFDEGNLWWASMPVKISFQCQYMSSSWMHVNIKAWLEIHLKATSIIRKFKMSSEQLDLLQLHTKSSLQSSYIITKHRIQSTGYCIHFTTFYGHFFTHNRQIILKQEHLWGKSNIKLDYCNFLKLLNLLLRYYSMQNCHNHSIL